MIERPLMENGELKLIYGANRFCQYLGIEPTGYYERIGVDNGTVPLKELQKGCLCPVSFSGLRWIPLRATSAARYASPTSTPTTA